MSDTDSQSKPTGWQLPPAPGQYGAKPDQPPPEPQDVPEVPYGFRPIERSGVGPFNPYIPTGQNPALRDRAAHDWGKNDWVTRSIIDGVSDGMHVPQEQDIPSIFHNFTMEVGKWGPPGVAMPAIAGGRFYGTAMQMYAKNQVQQANMARQNALASYQISQLRLGEYLEKAGNIYAEYGATSDADPGHPDKLHNDLWNLAVEYGDENMKRLLSRGDYDAVDKLMKHLDNNLSDLKKASEQTKLAIDKEKLKQEQQKTADAEAVNKEWYGNKTPPAQPSPAPTGAPAAGPQVAGPPTGVPSSETGDTEAVPTMPLAPDRINKAAQAMQMGEKEQFPNKKIASDVATQRQNLDDYMRKIARSKMKDEQKMAAIRAANPGIADRVEGLRSGREAMTDKTSTSPDFELASTILGSMDPGWTSHAQKIKEQKAHAADMAELGSLRSTLTQQERTHSGMKDVLLKNKQDMDLAVRLAKQLKAHGKLTNSQLLNQWELEGREKFSNDPEVAAYQMQMREIRSDIGKILSNSGISGAGTLAVATQHEMDKLLPSGGTPEMLEAQSRVLKRDYANKITPIGDEINSLKKQIYHVGGKEFKPEDAVDDSELVKDLEAEQTKVIGGKKYWLRIDDDGKAKWYDE